MVIVRARVGLDAVVLIAGRRVGLAVRAWLVLMRAVVAVTLFQAVFVLARAVAGAVRIVAVIHSEFSIQNSITSFPVIFPAYGLTVTLERDKCRPVL